jgi:hypothetical protein
LEKYENYFEKTNIRFNSIDISTRGEFKEDGYYKPLYSFNLD